MKTTAILSAALFLGSAAKAAELEIPRLGSAVKIDGVLDDAAWTTALKVTGFTQFELHEDLPATEETTAWLGYDDNNLYAAFEAKDKNPARIAAHLTPRDNCWSDDWVAIALDTFGDQRRSYLFFSNPLGVQMDSFRSGGKESSTPDFVYHSKGRLTPDGYIVEMKIPFKSLRFPRSARQKWGLSFIRFISAKNEKISWPQLKEDRGEMLSQTAAVSLRDVGKSARLEAIPEMTFAKPTPYQYQPDSFHINNWNIHAGANLRYGLTPDWTLDTAYNPDFSQIETDAPQITVNQRYPLFYEEKRPFFMEGADIFSTPFTLVNTRAIANPEYGIKLTGKEAAWTGGAIYSRDRSGGGSNFGILRLNRDVGRNSTLGVLYTYRGLNGGDYNRVAAIDGTFKFNDVYSLCFQSAGAFTREGASPTSNATANYASFSRSARNLSFAANYTDISPDMRSDTGYFSRTDIRKIKLYAGYEFYTKNDILLAWNPFIYYTTIYNYSGTHTDSGVIPSIQFTLPHTTYITVSYQTSGFERYAGQDFNTWFMSFDVSSQLSKYFGGSAHLDFGNGINYDPLNAFNGDMTNADVSLRISPSPSLTFEESYLKSRLDKKSGERVYDENILRHKLTWQITKELSTRLIYQYATLEHEGFANALLSYVAAPGTAFYLGYDVSVTGDRGPIRRSGETIFSKISYRFGI